MEESIMKFVVDELLDGSGDVRLDTPLFSDGVLDSFHLISLLMFLEETFKVKLSPEDLTPENMDTVGSIAAVVQARTARN